ncbi:MAG TPA: serine/threonine-protein kinase [Vicinamibacterales bacterium]|nr:serine/threonine-protein kinase [Vicinamibacterales bacterium]
MKGERWDRVKELFGQALEQPPASRRAWLARMCAGDYDVGSQAEALLDAYDADPDFLEGSAEFDPADLADALGVPAASGTLAPGTILGDGQYQIIGELGRGGMGVVYVAQDLRLPRRVALKSLPEAARRDPVRLERLRREAWAAARISHPAVATVYAFEELGDQPFIVSEYVRGRTLRSEIERGPLAPDRAIGIAIAIAGALSAAHEQDVVHRDLKPENVLITDSGSVKVVDFGIAQLAQDSAPALTKVGTLLGTPAYMAPEQIDGGGVDGRADLYSLGIVLSEMLTGRHPLRTRTTPFSARSSDPVTADTAPAPLPGPLAVIVKRCLQLLPAERYGSARELLRDLEQASRASVPVERHDRASAIWWWEFHQVATAVIYWITVVVAWDTWHRVRSAGVEHAGLLFVVILISVVVSANLRLNLWFTSRFFPTQLSRVRTQMRWWIRAGDWVLVASLVSAGLLVLSAQDASNRAANQPVLLLAVVLMGIGIGAAVASSLIEPVTARAAFDES